MGDVEERNKELARTFLDALSRADVELANFICCDRRGLFPYLRVGTIGKGMLSVELQLIIAQNLQSIDQMLEPLHGRHPITANVEHQAPPFKGWCALIAE